MTIGPELSSRKMRFRLYPEFGPGSSGAFDHSPADERQNVVVYLETAPGMSPLVQGTPRQSAMQQVNETFVPHVLPVVKGSTVDFPNGDPIFHNVFSLSKAQSFDLGRYPQHASKRVRFDKPGVVKVFCQIHSDMSAVVLVLDNPFFDVPDREGNYRIDDVPPGEYKLIAWHERSRPVQRQVRVLPGQTTAVDVSIPARDVEGMARRGN